MKRYFHVLLISYLLFYKENRNHFSDVTGIELWKHLENFGELEIAVETLGHRGFVFPLGFLCLPNFHSRFNNYMQTLENISIS